MEGTWKRIEDWLAAHAPAAAAGLNPPASDADIAAAEQCVGVTFPEAVRASFRRHDGQDPEAPWLMDGWELLSLARLRDEWKVWRDLLDGGDFAETRSDGDGETVRSDWWHPAWIPLTYNGCGDHHCVDLAPGPQGTAGQIIEMWHDNGARPAVAPGLEAWLAAFADDLERGAYELSDEGRALHRREDAPPQPAPPPSPTAGPPVFGQGPLPAAFDATTEPVKSLAKAKAKVAKGFAWTKTACLFEAVHLAHLLHLFGRDDESLEICAALGEYQFSGGYQLWSAVEKALALQARLLTARGETAAAEECVRRMREAGFVEDRLEGSMLDRNGAIPEAMKDGDRRWETSARLGLAGELAFIQALGGSAALPPDRLDDLWRENRERLRELTG